MIKHSLSGTLLLCYPPLMHEGDALQLAAQLYVFLFTPKLSLPPGSVIEMVERQTTEREVPTGPSQWLKCLDPRVVRMTAYKWQTRLQLRPPTQTAFGLVTRSTPRTSAETNSVPLPFAETGQSHAFYQGWVNYQSTRVEIPATTWHND